MPTDDHTEHRSAQHLATNMRALRTTRGLTQVRAAALAELPRATWATLEGGDSNPTLAVLVRVARALQVTIEELIAPPPSSGRLYRAAALSSRRKGKVTVRELLPDPVPGMELERLELPPGAAMSGVPHTPGTREYLTCETGRIGLAVAGKSWELAPGDVVVFRGDQRHGYRNAGVGTAVGYTVVVLAPATRNERR